MALTGYLAPGSPSGEDFSLHTVPKASGHSSEPSRWMPSCPYICGPLSYVPGPSPPGQPYLFPQVQESVHPGPQPCPLHSTNAVTLRCPHQGISGPQLLPGPISTIPPAHSNPPGLPPGALGPLPSLLPTSKGSPVLSSFALALESVPSPLPLSLVQVLSPPCWAWW